MTQVVTGQQVVPSARTASPSASQTYQGFRAQREVLGNQLNDLQHRREELVQQLTSGDQSAATKISLEKRIANVDERIADLDRQVAASDQAVATAAAVPGATYRPPEPPRQGPPEEAYALGALFMFIVFLPLTFAYARRIWRRSANATVVLPPEMLERMESLERGVDAIALEVERIGEGQRFMTQALTERSDSRALGAGGAEPVPVRQRERVEERR